MIFYLNSNQLEQLQYLLDDLKTEITNEEKEIILNNIIKFKADIKALDKNYESESDKLLLYNKYNSEVINIRKQFSVSKLIFNAMFFILIVLFL